MPYQLRETKVFRSQLDTMISRFPISSQEINASVTGLCTSPAQGEPYPGFGQLQLRKLRVQLKSYRLSKRNGARLIYLVAPEKRQIVPILIYKKGDYQNKEFRIKEAIKAKIKEIISEISEGE